MIQTLNQFVLDKNGIYKSSKMQIKTINEYRLNGGIAITYFRSRSFLTARPIFSGI